MEYGIENNLPEIKSTQKLALLLSGLYVFLSYFEIYLPGSLGSVTRYLIFLLSILFLYSYKWKIRTSSYIVFVFLWFAFRMISVSWSNHSNDDVSRLLISQIGMVLLLVSMCGRVHDEKLLKVLIHTNYWSSFAFGLLTLRFHRSYISEVFVARQVLTLFGKQNDPNNCAAFLAIGVAIAAYSLVSEKRMKILNIILILVNSYGIMLTASRGGFVMIGAIALVLLLLPNTDKTFIRSSFIKKAVIACFVLVIGIWAMNRFLPATSLNRMLAFDEYSAGSGRTEKWSQAWHLFLQRPLFGWGWGGYTVIGYIIHNTYLTMLCDVGVFGTSLFMIPIFQLISRLTKNKYQLGLIVLVTGIIPAIFLDSINKRYFWNAIIIAIMMLENFEITGKPVFVWPNKEGEVGL